jgi:DNA-binding transcriptional LysR family regulator
MKIQLESLSSFIAAADTGSFSAAGRKLKKSQAAISLSIQNLEIDLGFSLFDRDGKYPQLTQQGELFLKDTRQLMSQYTAFIERSKSISNVEQIKLCIGIDPLVCCHKINKIILDFSIAFPLVELKIVQQNSESLAQKLTDKTLDFALGVFSQNVKKHFEHIAAFHLIGSWIVSPSYVETNNLQLDNGVVKIEKSLFNQSRILLSSEIPLTDMDESTLTKQIWYVEDIHTLLSFCRNGLGIAYLPNFVVAHDLEKGSLNKLVFDLEQVESSSSRVSLIYNLGYQKSPAVEWLTNKFSNFKLCDPMSLQC